MFHFFQKRFYRRWKNPYDRNNKRFIVAILMCIRTERRVWRHVPYATCHNSLRQHLRDQLVLDPSANDLTTPVSQLTLKTPLHSLVQDLSNFLPCHDRFLHIRYLLTSLTLVNSPCMHVQCKLTLQIRVNYVTYMQAAKRRAGGAGR